MYQTPDMNLAAFLSMKGLPFTLKKEASFGKCQFIFSDIISGELIDEFYNSDCNKYAMEIRSIKSRIKNQEVL